MINRRREAQRVELDRRSALSRRIQLDRALLEHGIDRRRAERRRRWQKAADNAMVARWMERFHAARATRREI